MFVYYALILLEVDVVVKDATATLAQWLLVTDMLLVIAAEMDTTAAAPAAKAVATATLNVQLQQQQ